MNAEKLQRYYKRKKEELFGVAEKYSHSKLKFSDCEFSKNIKDYFKCYMKDSDIKPEENFRSTNAYRNSDIY